MVARRWMCGKASVLIVVMLGLVACKPAVRETVKIEHLMSEGASGDLSVELYASRKVIETHEMLSLRLSVSAAVEEEVVLPQLGGKWGDFTVFDVEVQPTRLGQAGQVIRESVYTLEPDLPARYAVTAVTVQTQGGEQVVVTDAFEIEVRSVLGEGEEEWQDLAMDVEKGEEASSEKGLWLMTSFIAVGVCVCVLLLSVLSKREERETALELVQWKDLEKREGLSVREKLDHLEKSVCLVVSGELGDKKGAIGDFPALEEHLAKKGVRHLGFTEALREYEKLQYASTTPSEQEARDLYERFHVLHKEVMS